MNDKHERGLKLLAIAIVLLLLSVMVSCQSLNPFNWGEESAEDEAPPANAVTATLNDVTDSAQSWAWLSILLVFVFPQARQPIVAFISSVFTALALPFNLLIDKFKK